MGRTEARLSAGALTLLAALLLPAAVHALGSSPAIEPACSDSIDNDLDGLVDFPDDPGCQTPFSPIESFPFACLDHFDNDADLAIDFPGDRSCYAANDPSEAAACANGSDDDGDGAIDFPADSGCAGAWDETENLEPECADRIDNDLDGAFDFPADSGCHAANDPVEATPVAAPETRTRVLVAVATSASLNRDLCAGTFTFGDGSAECPGLDVTCATCPSERCGNGIPDDSRIQTIRAGLASLFLRTEVEAALLRGGQRAAPFFCPNGSATSAAGGWQGGGPLCGGSFGDGELLVRFDDASYGALAGWVDADSGASSPRPEPGSDFELRGSGARALAGLLERAGLYLAEVRMEDPEAGCRPYRVLLLADGAEACGGDAPTAAAALAAAGVPVEVVGLSVPGGEIAALNAVAAAGGTGAATFVDGTSELVTGLAAFVESSGLVELCNGLDDDCDGEVDETFPGLGGSCDNGLLGACHRSSPRVCTADQRSTTCDAPPVTGSPEVCNLIDDDCDGATDEGGVCAPTAELCNGLDDDGDGLVDEDFPRGLACTDGGIGSCRGSGAYQCNAQQTWVTCVITVPGSVPAPSDTLCDGRDEDCDGEVDEEADGAMVTVATGGGGSFAIDRFEASRPDASAFSEGFLGTRACSKIGALPWRSVSAATAAAACAAAGKRLCTAAEWQAACEGPQGRTYPYGNLFLTQACNGEPFDPDCAGADDDLPLPTGTAYGCPPPSASACASAAGVLDLSGNLTEWTSTAAGVSSRVARGGAFDSQAAALTCQHELDLPIDSVGKPDLGFRCCADVPPSLLKIFANGFETGDTSKWSVRIPL